MQNTIGAFQQFIIPEDSACTIFPSSFNIENSILYIAWLQAMYLWCVSKRAILQKSNLNLSWPVIKVTCTDDSPSKVHGQQPCMPANLKKRDSVCIIDGQPHNTSVWYNIINIYKWHPMLYVSLETLSCPQTMQLPSSWYCPAGSVHIQSCYDRTFTFYYIETRSGLQTCFNMKT